MPNDWSMSDDQQRAVLHAAEFIASVMEQGKRTEPLTLQDAARLVRALARECCDEEVVLSVALEEIPGAFEALEAFAGNVQSREVQPS